MKKTIAAFAAPLALVAMPHSGCFVHVSNDDCTLSHPFLQEVQGESIGGATLLCHRKPQYVHITIQLQQRNTKNGKIVRGWKVIAQEIKGHPPEVGKAFHYSLVALCPVENRVRLYAFGRGISHDGTADKYRAWYPNLFGRPTGGCDIG